VTVICTIRFLLSLCFQSCEGLITQPFVQLLLDANWRIKATFRLFLLYQLAGRIVKVLWVYTSAELKLQLSFIVHLLYDEVVVLWCEVILKCKCVSNLKT